ncbi:MAG: hypothetical protein NTW06_04500 [Candidatus Falkowbacteria bacterium]|nr:hypothetical protein [Candidatus Falkowbacteria bacterium]
MFVFKDGKVAVDWEIYKRFIGENPGRIGTGRHPIFFLNFGIMVLFSEGTYSVKYEGNIVNPPLMGKPMNFVKQEEAMAYGRALFGEKNFSVEESPDYQ